MADGPNRVRGGRRRRATHDAAVALLKRGHYGVFHHFSKKHMHRYCDEFSFRWNGRKLEDSERRTLAIQQVEGKRLLYRKPVEKLPPLPGEQLWPFPM